MATTNRWIADQPTVMIGICSPASRRICRNVFHTQSTELRGQLQLRRMPVGKCLHPTLLCVRERRLRVEWRATPTEGLRWFRGHEFEAPLFVRLRRLPSCRSHQDRSDGNQGVQIIAV